jgi:uncharacterized membrane protein YhaH (DUF805 family)
MKEYFVSDGVSKDGPFTDEQLLDFGISGDSLVWRSGMKEWKQAKDVPDLVPVLEQIPPPIPRGRIEPIEELQIPPPLPQPNEGSSDDKNENEERAENVKEKEENSEGSASPSYKRYVMFSRPFSFGGRIERLEYGITLLIYWALTPIIQVFAASPDSSWMALFHFVLFWFLLAQGEKRCHDFDKSGWWQIVPFYFLWMLFTPGDKFLNDYGAPRW